jgi:hypothetical protein
MRDSITQEMPNGRGIVCFAFVANISYKMAAQFLGEDQAKSNHFILKHFREELHRFCLSNTSKHIRPGSLLNRSTA